MKKRFAASMVLAVLCVIGIASAQLAAPQLNSPVNNAVDVGFSYGAVFYVTVQWQWVTGASPMMVYQAQISTDTNFASHFVCDSTFRHMPHVIGVPVHNLTNNTTYFWRVRASDTAAGSQWGPWSGVWKFTTAATTSIAHDRSENLSAAARRVEISLVDSKLFVRNAAVGGIVRLYSMNGSLLLSRTIASTEETFIVPAAINISGKSIVVTVKSGGQLTAKTVILP